MELSYDPAMGARPLRRVMQDKIADGIADFYLEHPDVHHLQADIVHNDLLLVKLS